MKYIYIRRIKSQVIAIKPPPPPSLQDQNSTSFNYFKILKHCKSNYKCIALAQINKKQNKHVFFTTVHFVKPAN